MRQRFVLRTAAVVCAMAAFAPEVGSAGESARSMRARKAPPEVPIADVAARIDGALKTGLNTITADEVAKLLLDADPANDPFVLDIRERKDYLRGHVPGAVNVPLKKLPATWAKKPALIPADRNVVVVSYYGGDGNMASLLLNSVRITDPANFANFKWSKAMFMGMMTWSFDPALCNGHRFDSDLGEMRVDEPTETTAQTAGAFDAPKIPRLRAKSLEAAILTRADVAFRKIRTPNDLQVPTPELVDLVASGEAQILDVRSGTDYAKGHVPGAFNIAYKEVALATNAAKIDASQPVYVYCYTGHTGSLAAMALRLLGYDARNVLYGINGWRPSTTIASGQLLKFDLTRGWDFPVDDGGADDLGTMSAYDPPTGCVGCHTSLTAIYYDRTIANPPPAPPVVPSVGEG